MFVLQERGSVCVCVCGKTLGEECVLPAAVRGLKQQPVSERLLLLLLLNRCSFQGNDAGATRGAAACSITRLRSLLL